MPSGTSKTRLLPGLSDVSKDVIFVGGLKTEKENQEAKIVREDLSSTRKDKEQIAEEPVQPSEPEPYDLLPSHKLEKKHGTMRATTGT
eukprot:12898904-Prorocentrum_lima.AAC.1